MAASIWILVVLTHNGSGLANDRKYIIPLDVVSFIRASNKACSRAGVGDILNSINTRCRRCSLILSLQCSCPSIRWHGAQNQFGSTRNVQVSADVCAIDDVLAKWLFHGHDSVSPCSSVPSIYSGPFQHSMTGKLLNDMDAVNNEAHITFFFSCVIE